MWDLIGAHYELNIRQFWVKNYCDMRKAYRHLQQKRKKYEPMTKRRLDGCHLESASFFTFHKTGWSHTTGVAPFWTCQLVNNWTIIQLLSQFLLYSSSFLLDKNPALFKLTEETKLTYTQYFHSFEPSSVMAYLAIFGIFGCIFGRAQYGQVGCPWKDLAKCSSDALVLGQ